MPQMSPMNWIFMFNIILASIIIILVIINSMNMFKTKIKSLSKKMKLKNFNIKW